MLANRSRDTRPEVRLRSSVHRAGLRFRVADYPIAGVRRTADMVFRRARVAVFLDGCFWHGCPQHFVPPATNSEYWRTKIRGNVTRDRDTDRLLLEAGWLALRVWAHEDLDEATERVVKTVRKRLV